MMRAYADDVDLSTSPPYVSHTVLEPDGLGGCLVSGLTNINMEIFRLLKPAIKEAGFKYAIFKRIKNGITTYHKIDANK